MQEDLVLGYKPVTGASGVQGFLLSLEEDGDHLIVGAVYGVEDSYAHTFGYEIAECWNQCHRTVDPADAQLHLTKDQVEVLIVALAAQLAGSALMTSLGLVAPQTSTDAGALLNIIRAQVNQQKETANEGN